MLNRLQDVFRSFQQHDLTRSERTAGWDVELGALDFCKF
jgi:hypothetical protein